MSSKEGCFPSAAAGAIGQNPVSFGRGVFVRPREPEKRGSVERASDVPWVGMVLGDAKALPSFSQILVGSPNPTMVPKSPAKCKELQRWQLGRRTRPSPLDCPHSVWHLDQVASLYPTTHSPVCASSRFLPGCPHFLQS